MDVLVGGDDTSGVVMVGLTVVVGASETEVRTKPRMCTYTTYAVGLSYIYQKVGRLSI